MAASYRELFEFLEKLGDQLDRLTELQREKTAAVRRDDLNGVNDCMKREQVISLSLRSMDIKREKLLAELGLAGKPLSALPRACPPEHRARAQELADSLRERYALYKTTSQVARTTLEVNLHQIEKLMREASETPPPAGMADIRA